MAMPCNLKAALFFGILLISAATEELCEDGQCSVSLLQTSFAHMQQATQTENSATSTMNGFTTLPALEKSQMVEAPAEEVKPEAPVTEEAELVSHGADLVSKETETRLELEDAVHPQFLAMKLALDDDGGVDDEQAQKVEQILEAAAKDFNDTKASAILADMKNGTNSNHHAGIAVGKKGKDHDLLMEVIEEVSIHTSPEEEQKKSGTVVTSKMLEELNGLSDTPELGHIGTVEGDMVAEEGEQTVSLMQAVASGQRWAGNLWKNQKHIPYCFAPDIKKGAKQAFLDAIQHYVKHVPCLGFKEVEEAGNDRCSEQPGIYVQSKDDGCWAYVGAPRKNRSGRFGETMLNLQVPWCTSLGIAAHELGHSLGMTHEQSRTDHGDYVKVLWDNIKPGLKGQYNTKGSADTSGPYDVMSLMHYGDDFFGKEVNGKKLKTMEFVGAHSQVTMGNRQGLTYLDVMQVAKMYKCTDEVTEFKLCTEKEDGCTKEDCTCGDRTFKSSKTLSDKSTCNQCVPLCPDAPRHIPRWCGCEAPKRKDTLEQEGNSWSTCKKPEKCPAYPNGSKQASCFCEEGETREVEHHRGSTWYGCKKEPTKCPVYPNGVNDKSCSCGEPAKKQSFTSGGKKMYTCKTPTKCPDSPSGTGDSDCFCAGTDGEKETFKQNGKSFYMCRSPKECPEWPSLTLHDDCYCTGDATRATKIDGPFSQYGCKKRMKCPDAPHGTLRSDCFCEDSKQKGALLYKSGTFYSCEPKGTCDDKYDCASYKPYCNAVWFKPYVPGCKKTCKLC